MKKGKLLADFLLRMKALYRHAGKKARGALLDEFSAVTGYSRKHAMAVLRGNAFMRKVFLVVVAGIVMRFAYDVFFR